MWALIIFTVFVCPSGDMWQVNKGTSTVIPGYSSKETCENAGKEFKTDVLLSGFPRFEDRQKIRLKHSIDSIGNNSIVWIVFVLCNDA